jgi:hypothetical protein
MKTTTKFKSHDTIYLKQAFAQAAGEEYAHLCNVKARDGFLVESLSRLQQLVLIEKNRRLFPVLHSYVSDFLEGEMVWPPVRAKAKRKRA